MLEGGRERGVLEGGREGGRERGVLEGGRERGREGCWREGGREGEREGREGGEGSLKATHCMLDCMRHR